MEQPYVCLDALAQLQQQVLYGPIEGWVALALTPLYVSYSAGALPAEGVLLLPNGK
jgi:hypothetical protein